MTPIFRMLSTAAILVLISGLPPAGASTVTVASPGGGLFVLQGTGLEGVAGMDVTLRYDAVALRSPRIEPGPLVSGAMTEVNAKVPGTVRIAVISLAPLTGSGTIATLVFDRIGNASNPITGITVKFIDINGSPLQADTALETPLDTAASTGAQQPAVQGQGVRDISAPPQVMTPVPSVLAPGVVVRAPEGGTAQEKQPYVPPDTVPTPQEPHIAKADVGVQKGSGTPAGPATDGKAVFTQKSVLERFKEYRGPRTPAALLALFDQEFLIGCRQDPSLVLSDGKATARVAFIVPADAKGSPDVALIGAALVSLKRDREHTNMWVAEVRPHRNALEVKMTIPLAGKAMVIPITVAPKALIAPREKGRVTEKDFASYLAGTGGKGSKGRDLNGDGRSDYLDDYIFTANYRASLKSGGVADSHK